MVKCDVILNPPLQSPGYATALINKLIIDDGHYATKNMLIMRLKKLGSGNYAKSIAVQKSF